MRPKGHTQRILNDGDIVRIRCAVREACDREWEISERGCARGCVRVRHAGGVSEALGDEIGTFLCIVVRGVGGWRSTCCSVPKSVCRVHVTSACVCACVCEAGAVRSGREGRSGEGREGIVFA